MQEDIKEAKWRTAEALIDSIIENPEKYPEEMVILSLTDEELGKVLTKERLRIVRTIQEKAPRSVRELARMLDRDIGAVDRDIKILRGYEMVELEKHGKESKPLAKKKILVLPLFQLKPKTLEEIVA